MGSSSRLSHIVVFAATVCASLLLAVPAMASYPGLNGRLAFTASVPTTFDQSIDGLFTVPTRADDPDQAVSSVTFESGLYGSASYSADGQKLAYLKYVDGAYEVYAANSYGHAPHRLVSNDHQKLGLSLSPDGSTIVFDDYDFATGQSRLLRVAFDGDGTEVPASVGPGKLRPAWSPDGSKIASAGFGKVHVLNVSGGSETLLDGAPGGNISPDWSPDGSQLVFAGQSALGKSMDIYKMNADGSGVTRLVRTGREDIDPVWSPDGTKIAYVSHPLTDSARAKIYTADTNGKHRRLLIRGKYHFTNVADPGWQPVK